SRGHFVTKFGCGDGPPIKLFAGKGKSDRDARQIALTELRRLVSERDQGRATTKPMSQITVEDHYQPAENREWAKDPRDCNSEHARKEASNEYAQEPNGQSG